MHSLKYRIITRSPVIVSAISGDTNMVKTEKYISGGTVLGLLAKRFIDRQQLGGLAHENKEFYQWFLAGGLKISNAYIFWRDEADNEFEHYPTPFSVEQEKYGDMVYDRLFTETEQTKHVGDFCLLQGDFVQTRTVETEINFHHARDREKGVSKEGLIFNYESLVANQVFTGEIYGGKDDLQNLLLGCGSDWLSYIGRSRNAQYGAVEFEFVNNEPAPVQNQIIRPAESEGNQVQSISMALLSDLILHNECGFPTTDIRTLETALQNQLGEVRIAKAFVKKAEIENFVSIWRLKKPSEVCFAAGSTFLLQIAPEKVEALADIQVTGLGERTQEGFGRCAFGLQTQSNLIKRDEAKDEADQETQKPAGEPPENVRRIIKTIVQKTIRERIATAAINEQENFEHLPSNALIARLHAMAKAAEDRSDFVVKLNSLRDIAMKQLRQCVSRDCNLLEYLAAFRLSESGLKRLEESGFDNERITALKKLDRRREFPLIENLTRAVGKKPDDRSEFEQLKSRVLAHAEFYYNPVDWNDFFRQTKNDGIKPLCDEIGFTPEKDVVFTRELARSFYTTFFAEMRKRKIAAEEMQNVE